MRYLQNEFAAHPLAQPQDAVKLLYQSAFGCGHMLSDADACAARIQDEITNTDADPSVPAYTLIGGGLCRMNLRSPAVRALSAQVLARMMKLTEARFTPSPERFDKSLAALSALDEAGQTPFSAPSLEDYLHGYRAEGYPVVSHTDRYRAAYQPAYRVVLSDFGTLLPALCAAEELVRSQGRAVVVLDGDCGAGKTTLAGLMAELLQAGLIHMDDFFLPFERRTEERKSVPGWNVDHERFSAEVLPKLQAGGAFTYGRFDCHTGVWEQRSCPSSPIVLIEGSYSHHPSFAEGYRQLRALRVFLSVPAAEQLRRLGLRDPDKLDRFEQEWIPLEKSYFEAYDIRSGADIVLQSTPWEDAE